MPELDKLPFLKDQYQEGNITNSVLSAPCAFALHKIPGQKNSWMQHLNKIVRMGHPFNENITTQGHTLSFGALLQEIFYNNLNLKNLNGEKALVYAHLLLCELMDQGLIEGFYHLDQPLLNQFIDPSFIGKKQCQTLDHLGIDILVEVRPGVFIPLQIKANGNLTKNCCIKEDPESAEDQTEYFLHIERNIPTLNMTISNYQDKRKLLKKLVTLINTLLHSKQEHIGFAKAPKDLSQRELITSLEKSGYIKILRHSKHELPSKPQHQARPEAIKQKKPGCFEEINIRLQQLLQNPQNAERNSRIAKVLDEFLQKTNPEKVLESDQKTWFRKINYRNKLGPAFRGDIKAIEASNPDSGYSVENFIALKEKLVLAIIEDNLLAGQSIELAELQNAFDRENFESELNSFSQPIQKLITTLREQNIDGLKQKLNPQRISKEETNQLPITTKNPQGNPTNTYHSA